MGLEIRELTGPGRVRHNAFMALSRALKLKSKPFSFPGMVFRAFMNATEL